MSSLVYLGLSIILFVVVYGIAFVTIPLVFGGLFQAVEGNSFILDDEWTDIFNQNKDTVNYLVPLVPALGIIVIIVKVLMTSSARGRD